MKKELTINIIFGVLYLVIAITTVAYYLGYRTVANTDTSIKFIKTGAINVESDGEKNQVYLNEVYKGEAPQRIDGLVPENYKVTIRKDGYEPFISNVNVIEDNYINIKPHLVKSAFGAKKLFETNISPSYSFKYFKESNSFVILSLEKDSTLTIHRITNRQPIFGFINEEASDEKISISGSKISDISKLKWGLDSSSNILFAYDSVPNSLLIIDLITGKLSNSISLNGIIVPTNLSLLYQEIYMYDNEKIYKYNLATKSIALKYSSQDEGYTVSSNNPTILFNNDSLRILSQNSTSNEFTPIKYLYSSDRIVEDALKIDNTNTYALVGKDFIEVINSKGERLSFLPITHQYFTTDALHVLSENSIYKYSIENNIYVEQKQNRIGDELFNFENVNRFRVFDSRTGFVITQKNDRFVSDYYLTSFVKLPVSQKTLSYEVYADSLDKLYLLSIEPSEINDELLLKAVIYRY